MGNRNPYYFADPETNAMYSFLDAGKWTAIPIVWTKCLSYNEAAIAIDLLTYRNRMLDSGNIADPSSPFFVADDLSQKHGMRPNTITDILKRIKKKGLISIERKGIPSRNHYIIIDTAYNLLVRAATKCDSLGHRTVKQWIGEEFTAELFLENPELLQAENGYSSITETDKLGKRKPIDNTNTRGLILGTNRITSKEVIASETPTPSGNDSSTYTGYTSPENSQEEEGVSGKEDIPVPYQTTREKRSLSKAQDRYKHQRKKGPGTPVDPDILKVIREVCEAGGFRHKIKPGIEPQSKLIQRAATYIKKIMDGTMYRDNPLHVSQQDMVDDFIYGAPLDIVRDALVESASRLKTLANDNYSSRKLAQSIDSFIYNPQAQRSWFLQLLRDPPEEGKEERGRAIRDSLPRAVRDPLKKMAGRMDDKLAFWSRIKDMHEWHKDKRDFLKLVDDSSFGPYAYGVEQFFALYAEFAAGWKGWGVGSVGLESGTWDHFIAWMEDRDIILSPRLSKKARREMEEKAEQIKEYKRRKQEKRKSEGR